MPMNNLIPKLINLSLKTKYFHLEMIRKNLDF